MTKYEADRWSGRLSTTLCVCVPVVVGVCFLSLQYESTCCPVLSSPDRHRGGWGWSAHRYLCESEAGKEQGGVYREDTRERVIHNIHMIFFFFFTRTEACVLDRRECVRGTVMKKMEKEGRA